MAYELVDRETILDSEHAVFMKDRVVLPNGQENDFYYHDAGNTVLIVPVLSENQILMIKNYRYVQGKKCLEFPAGFVDEGEDPEEAAKRELKEETGYTAEKFTKLTTMIDWVYSKMRLHVFIAEGLEEGEQELDGSEDIEVIKLSWEDAMKKILEEPNPAPSIASLSLARRKLDS